MGAFYLNWNDERLAAELRALLVKNDGVAAQLSRASLFLGSRNMTVIEQEDDLYLSTNYNVFHWLYNNQHSTTWPKLGQIMYKSC